MNIAAKEPPSQNYRFHYLGLIKTLTINLSRTIDFGDKEAKMAMASKLYDLGKLTLGQAADLAGYSKETFMELLADYGVSLFNHSREELDEDIRNAEGFSLCYLCLKHQAFGNTRTVSTDIWKLLQEILYIYNKK